MKAVVADVADSIKEANLGGVERLEGISMKPCPHPQVQEPQPETSPLYGSIKVNSTVSGSLDDLFLPPIRQLSGSTRGSTGHSDSSDEPEPPMTPDSETSGAKDGAHATPCDSADRPVSMSYECLTKTNLTGLRFRKSCYFDATVRYGVKSFYSYNHMLLPITYSSQEDEAEHLRHHVALWDVACERQIEIAGPDALALAEMLTPRALGGMNVGDCRYAIMTDEEGKVLNDPVVLKLAEDRFWFSIADSDMLYWVKGLAIGRGFDASVTEAAVSPLAVQGPKSLPLMCDLFGNWVGDLKFYAFRETQLDGIPMLLARSGWSPERGYEMYLMDESRGDELWEKVMVAGEKYCIKPGSPNNIRRIEGGLLNFGSDVTTKHNVMELGLPPKWCSGDKKADFLAKGALQRLSKDGGPIRRVMGLEFIMNEADSKKHAPVVKPWRVQWDAQGSLSVIGHLTSLCFSPKMGTFLGIATLSIDAAAVGTKVRVEMPDREPMYALVRKLPFLPRAA